MLHVFDSFRGVSFAAVLIKLLLSFIIGTVIGLERSYHNKPAGFRTHILVVLGAAIASMTGIYLYVGLSLPTDVSRIAAGVVTGLGFIGAGTIVVTRKQKVKGLTTAAGLWTSGLIGLCIGAGFYEGGILGTLMIIFVETSLNNIRNRIQFAPEFSIALSYYHRSDLDEVMRFCKDHDAAITNLKITSNKDSGAALYSALLTLKVSNDMTQQEFADQIDEMNGIVSAELI
ncbi:MAG: MgtC/SapB family protein [Erysipelotrichaceae bacterium]|nr:MgtC/SapB family protein [Erysipelotrichaceae bacterium]